MSDDEKHLEIDDASDSFFDAIGKLAMQVKRKFQAS